MDKPVLIVVAGGASRRFGGDKLLAPLRGRPVLTHSLEKLAPAAERTVLVVPAGREAEFRKVLERFLPDLNVLCVPGGATRPESVRRGFAAACPRDDELVAVHDAARPLATAALLRALCRRAAECGAAIPGFPQADAQKRTEADGTISADLPRDNVWNVGTPQVFRADILRRALASPGADAALDDAEAVRGCGFRVAVVPWTEPNLKLTCRADLRMLELLAEDPGKHFVPPPAGVSGRRGR